MNHNKQHLSNISILECGSGFTPLAVSGDGNCIETVCLTP